MEEQEVVPAILALMIPIVGIIMGIGLPMLAVLLDYRRKREMFELHHKERMAAIDKGIELPPLAVDFLQSRRKHGLGPPEVLRRGLILFFGGAALIVALSQEVREHAWWGLIPVAFGAAYLVSYFIERGRAGVAHGGPAIRS
jgi:hypothetical protein